jgi:excisionase family DNA binding protein
MIQHNLTTSPFRTVDELAARWGLNRGTVISRIKTGQLKTLRIGKAIRISELEVSRFEQKNALKLRINPNV